MLWFPCRRILYAAFLSLLVVACSDKSGPPQQQPMAVTVVTLAPQPVTLKRSLSGRASPYRVAEVRPQVDGIIKERLFVEGASVDAGQALYQIDDSLYKANLASAEANLMRAKANLEAVKLKADRAKRLVKNNTVSKEQYDDAIAALGQAKADVKGASANADHARIMLGYARIAAPIAGWIDKSSVTPGALVTANQAMALTTIYQLDPIYVDLTLSSSEWLSLQQARAAGRIGQANQTVAIFLEDGSRYAHPGALSFTGVDVNPSTGSIQLRVVVPNPDHILLPGMYVRAEVNTGELPNAILVPQIGVTRDAQGNAVALVVNGDNKVERRVVTVGQAMKDKWLVKGGLSAGDRVIVEGVQKVRPGMLVNAMEFAKTATGG